jgi:hypothetical protein
MIVILSCSDENKQTDTYTSNEKIPKKFSISDKKIFGLKSGIIEYKITGSQTGSKKLYFDDWGRKQAEFSNSTIRVGEYSKHSNLLKITKGDKQYVIDLDDKTGTKRENPVIEKMMDLSNQINYGDFGEQLILIDGGFESGTEIISDKKCKIYKFSKQKKTWWVWNWILLKSEINRGGINITIEAINIEGDVNIPENIFAIPPEVLITEIDLEGLRKRERENPVNE